MKRSLITLAVLSLIGSGPASAGWDDVFQTTCWRSRSRSSCYEPAPAPARDVHYEQRCYYEPITVMKPQVERVEVPVQVKSYYWDPVTSYTHTSYYDPCTGCSQRVAVPHTSYVRKESCSTVTKYVERVRMVPVEERRKVCEKRPVYTYYGPTTKSYEAPQCDSCEANSAPRVDEMRTPSVQPERSSSAETIPPQDIPPFRNNSRTAPAKPYNGPVNARTTSRTALLHGEVVANDQTTPKPGAKLVFVNVGDDKVREYATADGYGGFDLRLPAGEWYIYVGSGDGRANFHKKIRIEESESREFKLVSR